MPIQVDVSMVFRESVAVLRPLVPQRFAQLRRALIDATGGTATAKISVEPETYLDMLRWAKSEYNGATLANGINVKRRYSWQEISPLPLVEIWSEENEASISNFLAAYHPEDWCKECQHAEWRQTDLWEVDLDGTSEETSDLANPPGLNIDEVRSDY